MFNPGEALDLCTRILTHHGSHTTDSADTVCAELGHLALAVKQAAAYCAETGTNPHDYLDMLVQWPATMFATSATSSDPKRTIARIWRLTLNHLTDTPLAGSLLRILAWYAPDNIPRDLLHNLAEPPQLAAAIGRLTPYSMITANHGGILTIYCLLQALARALDRAAAYRAGQGSLAPATTRQPPVTSALGDGSDEDAPRTPPAAEPSSPQLCLLVAASADPGVPAVGGWRHRPRTAMWHPFHGQRSRRSRSGSGRSTCGRRGRSGRCRRTASGRLSP